jgi:hypothetical protein
MCGTRKLLVHADDVDLPRENKYVVIKNTRTLKDASKKVCLEVNVEKI